MVLLYVAMLDVSSTQNLQVADTNISKNEIQVNILENN